MESERPSYDYYTKLVIPALSLAGTITSVLKDQPRLAALLAAVAALSLLIGVARPLYERTIDWFKRRHDDQISIEVWPDLMVLVEQFGRFIDQNRSDSLHGIVLANSSAAHLAISGIVRQHEFVPASVLWGPWNQIAHVKQDSSPSRLRLQDTTGLFTWLIATYHYYVIQPVFARGTSALEQHLTPQIKRDLAAAREALVRFEADYKGLIDRTNRRLQTVVLSPPSLNAIPPL